jgi:hypothetical protein
MEITVERWHSEEGNRIVLVKRGRKNLHFLVQDHPVHVETRPLAEERYLTPLDYPVQRAIRRVRNFCKHGNATKGALSMLRECAS